MKHISEAITTLSKGSGSSLLVLKKEYCKAMGVAGGKGAKLKQTLVLDKGKFKTVIEKPEEDDSEA